MTRKKVLLLAYHFPPIGGPGVQRAVKFVKYLPEFGWDPIVLTSKNINYSVYDYSLAAELDPSLEIVRTESLDPQRLSYFLFSGSKEGQSDSGVVRNARFREGSLGLAAFRRFRDFLLMPDAALGWTPFAYRAGKRVISRHGIDAILALAPPNSSAILAKWLSASTRVPYVVDFRDPWADGVASEFPTETHRRLHRWLEGKTVSTASAVTVYGEVYARDLREQYPSFRGPLEELTNGFDPADLHGVIPQARTPGKARIVYQGSLNYYHKGNLETLIEALRRLAPELRASLEIFFVGRSPAEARERVSAAGMSEVIKFLSYRPHGEALAYLASADAALLFVQNGDLTSVTGKVFEYIMAGRPILACVEPRGACADLLRRAGFAEWIVPADAPEEFARAITSLADAGWPRPGMERADQFSRRSVTKNLAKILDQVSKRRSQ